MPVCKIGINVKFCRIHWNNWAINEYTMTGMVIFYIFDKIKMTNLSFFSSFEWDSITRNSCIIG